MTAAPSQWKRKAGDGPGTTLPQLLEQVVRAHPDRVALVDGAARENRWTYAELHRDAQRVARSLADRCAPGDRVVISGPNRPSWVIAELGAALAGLVVVGVNPAMTAAELGYVLGQSGAKLVLTAAENRGVDQIALFEGLRAQAPTVEAVLDLDRTVAQAVTEDRDGTLPEVHPDDPLLVQYTSGTTGAPKGAILTHGGITRNIELTVARFEAEPGGVWLAVVPMHHLTGSVANTVGAITAASTHVIANWNPATALELIQAERVTLFQAVPTMLLAMMEQPGFASADLSSVDLVVSGGTVVLPEVVHRCEREFGCDFTVVFGQTEAGAYICVTRRSDSIEDRTERVGPALDCFDVRVVDPATGELVPFGAIGEFWLRGPSVMTGYHDQPEETGAALSADGWLRTGDLGFMDDRGYLQVTGKLKDVIIRSGVNVYPREVEVRMVTHPDVADVAVVGVPHERLGEQVVAFVRPVPGRTLDPAALTAYAREALAPHKVPAEWIPLTEFPLTASGKIQKFKLRAGYQDGVFGRAAVV